MPGHPVIRVDRHRWYLAVDALYAERKPHIDWRQLLPATGGSKHQREYMLGSMKGLLSAMIDLPESARIQTMSHGTVRNHFVRLCTLVKWMTARDIWRLSELQPEDLSEFLAARTGRNGVDKPRAPTVHRWMSLFVRMWELRTDYTAPLRFDPTPLFPDVLLRVRPVPGTRWKPLDESVALPLINDAVRWIEDHGEFIADLSQLLWHYRRTSVGLTRHEAKQRVRTLLDVWSSAERIETLRQILKMPKVGSYRVLRYAISLTEGACVTVLLFLLGMRISELLRLDSDCLLAEPGDSIETYRVNGVAAKKSGKTRSWVAPPPVATAIRTLQRLHAGARERDQSNALFLNGPPTNFKLAFPGRWTPSIPPNRMRRFSQAPFRSSWPDSVRLHPHVARKTFARFVVLRDKRALESLAHHFGHTHRAITDSHYVGADIELAHLLDEENRRDLTTSLKDLLSSPSLGGKAGAALVEMRDKFEAELRGKVSLNSVVNRLIEQGVVLAPCDWGYCVYAQSHSACHGGAAGPNEVNRSPDVCAGCSNFTATEKHRSWWEARLIREQAFLANETLPQQTRILVAKRAQATEDVLRGIVNGARPVPNRKGRVKG